MFSGLCLIGSEAVAVAGDGEHDTLVQEPVEALPTHLEQARNNCEGHTEFLEALLRVEVETTEQRRWETL